MNTFYCSLLKIYKLMTNNAHSLRYCLVINVKGWVCFHISITLFQSIFFLYLLFGFPYPYWFSLESIIMGAKDWAGLVNKALMPKTIEERGDLEQKKVACVYITHKLHVCIYVHVYTYICIQVSRTFWLLSPPWA